MWITDKKWRLSLIIVALLALFLLGLSFRSMFSSSPSLPPSAQNGIEVVAKDPSWATREYAVILDCGSSGSRVFVYHWPEHSGQAHKLLDIRQVLGSDGKPAVKKVEPGLSAFPDATSKATDQVVELLDFAKQHIPEVYHQDTHVYLMATAGMRMLKEEDQEKILLDIKSNVPLRTPFKVLTDNVEVISGKREGIYAWISINAFLGKLGTNNYNQPEETVGVIDMGGGSIQIAFEMGETDKAPTDVMESVYLGVSDTDSSLTFRLYVATYLGLGANSAIQAHFENLAKNEYQKLSDIIDSVVAKHSTHDTPVAVKSVQDPCYPLGYNSPVNVTLTVESGNHHVPIVINGSGQFGSCKNQLNYLLASLSSETNTKMASCGLFCSPLSGLPESIAFASQPPSSIKTKKFYGFSEFWYTMQDVFHMGGEYNRENFDKEATQFCSNEWDQLMKDYVDPAYSSADYQRFTTQCFKSAWVYTVLHSGFLFGLDTSNFASVQSINGSEVHWTLGALLEKTRKVPLRKIQEVENRSEAQLIHGRNNVSAVPFMADVLYYFPQIIFLFCAFIVLLAIVFYCVKLIGGGSNSSTGFPRRVDSDLAEMGLLKNDDFDTPLRQLSHGHDNKPLGRKNRMSLSVGSRMHHLA